jgi:hypothetical protein
MSEKIREIHHALPPRPSRISSRYLSRLHLRSNYCARLSSWWTGTSHALLFRERQPDCSLLEYWCHGFCSVYLRLCQDPFGWRRETDALCQSRSADDCIGWCCCWGSDGLCQGDRLMSLGDAFFSRSHRDRLRLWHHEPARPYASVLLLFNINKDTHFIHSNLTSVVCHIHGKKAMLTTSGCGGPTCCIQATGRSASKRSKFVDVSSPLQAVRHEGAEDTCCFHALKTVTLISP